PPHPICYFPAPTPLPTCPVEEPVLKTSDDFSLEDVLSSTAQLAAGADSALDALSDTLMDITPAPHQPPAVPPKDVVKDIMEEKLIKMGERDDTLPPEYRPTEEDLKVRQSRGQHAMNCCRDSAFSFISQNTMDDNKALDLLSSDFSAALPPSAAPVTAAADTVKLEPPPMAAPVLDSLAETLLPAALESKPKAEKPKVTTKQQREEPPSATDELSSQLVSDIVPKSATS
uniref:Calpastatin n=1 Tax=Cynoglossus semilaevis TaxID=244447 RepID=A0A3P8VWV1_CYNSE